MNRKKLLSIVFLTLIAGFAIGFFTAGRMAKHRINRHRNMMQDVELEKKFISEKLDLTTKQENVVFPLIDPMLRAQKVRRQEHHSEMEANHKNMLEIIRTHLDTSQMKNLKRFANKRRPPGGPPH